PAGVELDVDDLLLENPRRSRSRLEPNRVVARVEHEPSLNEAALELDAIESVRRFRFRFPACAGVVARFGRAFLGGHARRRDEDRAQSPRERDESRGYASERQRGAWRVQSAQRRRRGGTMEMEGATRPIASHESKTSPGVEESIRPTR